MAENPYQDPRFSDFGEQTDAGPTRTSRMAVASLVLGVVAPLGCIAGFALAFAGVATGGTGTVGGLMLPLSVAVAVLGLVLGAVALLLVYAKPRLSGAGYAIGGIVINMVTLGLLVVMMVAGTKLVGAVVGDASDLLAALETGDADAARQLMDPSVQAEVTDERVAAFSAELRDRLGTVDPPQSLMELISGSALQDETLQRRLQDLNLTGEQVVPLPLEGERGNALAVLFVNEAGMQGTPSLAGNILNVMMVPAEGDPFWLLPPESVQTPAGRVEGTEPAEPPTGGEEPAGEDLEEPPAGPGG